jgi:glycosyltransferase involved in cell wall biosynthesis
LDLKIFNPSLRAGARRSLDLEGSRPVILFASAQIQNPLKSIRLLEKAIAAAGFTAANCRVVYVGELLGGELPDWWRWLGNLQTESAMARCFAAADLTIVPSVVDNYPNVVAESLACGTPVLGSRVGGIPELVDHEYNGFLFKPGDIGDAAELIKLWANSKASALNALRTRARESAEATVDVHETSRQYLDLYQAMLESTRRATRQG